MKVIYYNSMMFASPRHLMNYLRKHEPDADININYLTQCVYKEVRNAKGLQLKYRHWDIEINEDLAEVYAGIKSLVRSGEGYIVGKMTPLMYFENIVKPLMNAKIDPVKEAITSAIAQGIGTEKDYEEFKAQYIQSFVEPDNACQFCKTGLIDLDRKGDATCSTQGCEFNG